MYKNQASKKKFLYNRYLCLVGIVVVSILFNVASNFDVSQSNITVEGDIKASQNTTTTNNSGTIENENMSSNDIDIGEQSNILTVEVASDLPSPEIDSKATDWNLILVNKQNKIPNDYKFTLKNIDGSNKVDERIAESLNNMLSDCRKAGCSPLICASYRSHEKQVSLFTKKKNEYINAGYSRTSC